MWWERDLLKTYSSISGKQGKSLYSVKWFFRFTQKNIYLLSMHPELFISDLQAKLFVCPELFFFMLTSLLAHASTLRCWPRPRHLLLFGWFAPNELGCCLVEVIDGCCECTSYPSVDFDPDLSFVASFPPRCWAIRGARAWRPLRVSHESTQQPTLNDVDPDGCTRRADF